MEPLAHIPGEEEERFKAAARAGIEHAKAKRAGRPTKVSKLKPIGVRLVGEFERAVADRYNVEQRWLMDLRQFKGIYDPGIAFEPGRSKVFWRKTRAKVKAVDSRLFDLLFPASKDRNYAMSSTPEPSIQPQLKQQIIVGLQAKAQQNQPTEDEIRQAIKEEVERRAGRMASTIDDQLVEAKYRRIAKRVIHSGNLYGTGILKGPLVEKRSDRPRFVWDEKGSRFAAQRETVFAPFIDFTPLWRFYPDMTVTEAEDFRYIWERHLMSRHGLLMLAKNPTADGERIRQYVESNPNGSSRPRMFEQDLRLIGDRANTDFSRPGQYELLERWGWLAASDLRDCGVKIPDAMSHDVLFSHLLMLPDGTPVKTSLQPLEAVEWLHHFYHFGEPDESSFFREGLAAIMRDDQETCNATRRAILDNAAITSGPQFEVYVDLLAPTENVKEMFPRKIWPRVKGDPQYPAIRAINADSHIKELGEIEDRFDRGSDEVTQIPKFFSGDNPTAGAQATASGYSMARAEANMALKDAVVEWDEGVTKPFICAMYAWNMQFNQNPEIKGDFDVSPSGAASLVAKEVRSQMLGQFAATAQPEQRAYIKWDRLTQQQAEAMDLTDTVKDKEEIRIDEESEEAQHQQELMQKQQELTVALLQAQVAKLDAEVAKLQAGTVREKVDSTYAAMQAGGVASTNPVAAAAGDEILKSSGYVDQHPTDTITSATQEGVAAPAAIPDRAGPRAGELAGEMGGIRTPATPG